MIFNSMKNRIQVLVLRAQHNTQSPNTPPHALSSPPTPIPVLLHTLFDTLQI